MYKKGAGNDKQEKDAGNRTLCPYRNFSQAIMGNIKYLRDIRCILREFRKISVMDEANLSVMFQNPRKQIQFVLK